MADINEIKAYIEKLTKKEEQGENVQDLWQLMNTDFENFKEEFYKRFPEDREEIKKAKEDEVEVKVGKEKIDISKIWIEEKQIKKEVKGEIQAKELIGFFIGLLGVFGLISTIVYKFFYGFSFGIKTKIAIIISIVLLIVGVFSQLKNKEVFKKDFIKSVAFQRIATIIIALFLIFTSIVLTNYYLMNTEPIPVIEVKYNGKELSDTNKAMAGEMLVFSAKKSYDKDGYLIEFKGEIVNYTWDLGDGTMSYEKEVKHYYLEDGIKTIKLKVKDNKGLEKTAKKEIKVFPLILKVPNKKIGDIGNYVVSGKIGAWNNETYLYAQKDIEYGIVKGDIYIKSVNLDKIYGTLDINVKNTTNKENGLKEEHKVLESSIVQDIKFDGKAKGEFQSNKGSAPIEFDINGYNKVNDIGFSDLYNNKTIQKNTISELSITVSIGKTFTNTFKDEIISYADITKEQFNFEEVYKNRIFDKGNDNALNYEIDKGGTTYYCSIQNIEKVKVGNEEKIGLKIRMTLDELTMERRGLTEFIAEFLVSKDFSYPLKTKIFGYGKDINEFLIDITASLKSFKNGDEKINYYCNSSHNILKRGNADFKNWSFSPEGKGSFKFSSKYAIDIALNESNNSTASFRKYINETKNAYVVFANYTEENDRQRWNFTFGKGNSEEIYNLTVVREGDNFTFYDLGKSWMFSQSEITFIQSKTRFSPKNSKFDLSDKILTIASFEDILKNEDKVKDIFSNNKIDYSKYFFEIKVDSPYPNIDINALFSEVDKSNYAYSLKSKDNSLVVSIDAEIGQLMYIVRHR